MNKKCGCYMSDPFGAPRENCSFCSGSGFREVVEAETNREFTFNLAREQKLNIEHYELKLAKASAEQAAKNAIADQKNIEAELLERKIQAALKKAELAKIRKREVQYQIDRKYFEPSPSIGTPEYEIVKQIYAGRLFKCLNCDYEANLYQDLACGNCGLKSGYTSAL
jgi:hypothetical protein